jgi:hypothetical protein
MHIQLNSDPSQLSAIDTGTGMFAVHLMSSCDCSYQLVGLGFILNCLLFSTGNCQEAG